MIDLRLPRRHYRSSANLGKTSALKLPSESMIGSYAQLAQALLGNTTGLCLFDGTLKALGGTGQLAPRAVAGWLRSLGFGGEKSSHPAHAGMHEGGQWLTAIALEDSAGELLAVLCVGQAAEEAAPPSARHLRSVVQRLKPCIECLQRELANAPREGTKLRTLTERTAELEWLFQVTSKLNGANGDSRVVEELLAAATRRLHSAFGALLIPEKQLCIEFATERAASELREAWTQTRTHLVNWTQRQRRPLVINTAGRGDHKVPGCKILAVPIVRENGRVMGLMAFFNPPQAEDYGNRQAFLARHLGRHAAGMVDAQFDLMTGLYTRDGLEQAYNRLLEEGAPAAERSVIFIDIDHMRVTNEVHGFELGNELIVRVAELLAPPTLPARAVAGRISADRFLVVLPDSNAAEALPVAQQLQAAAARLAIGPAQQAIEVSISCGIAALVDMPQGLARSVAAAEIACKTAKNRGRNRIELYACEDSSIMRHQDDAIAVGQLRAALKNDALELYAQPIVPLQHRALHGGYEILVRVRDGDGEMLSSGALMAAAGRYQLLPSVDRWVATRALRTLAPYRRMIASRGISMSINISGQSIADEGFTRMLTEELRAAALPAGSLMIEITEQAAVTNLARAHEMIQRLTALGCRFALDDFGTGTNSLTNLKALQISRVKIDGSFVRDIATDKRSQATVRGIVELARGLSLETVAEHVENETIADAVRRIGVDYAQGYAFGKPEIIDTLLVDLTHEESRRMRQVMLEM